MRARLGQHFLTNTAKIDQIIDALEIETHDTILEIGPGHGELTKELLKHQDVKILAIEKDPKLVSRIKYLVSSNLEIIEGDALKILSTLNTKYKIPNTGYKLLGNIPYYITGKLLRILGELERKPKLIVLTIQKEVAERICATPGKMNLLAAATQFWAKPKIVDFVSKKDFFPPPEVDSAIIKLETREQKTGNREQKNKNAFDYYKFIKILFRQPRKTILNNLSALKSKKEISIVLKKLKINPGARPQDLSIDIIKGASSLLAY
ncbi:MAG: 16S rRNA (adenine(1518)-N(6)/adenine(1519)-N(6))-dimethyltransferase RsmA [Patescibacteria group bacterium]